MGAGTALPSIVAAKCGAQVTITDSEKYKYVLKLAEYNMLSNNVNGDMFKISELIWGKFTPFVINSEQFDLILGSDVFYNPSGNYYFFLLMHLIFTIDGYLIWEKHKWKVSICANKNTLSLAF